LEDYRKEWAGGRRDGQTGIFTLTIEGRLSVELALWGKRGQLLVVQKIEVCKTLKIKVGGNRQ